MTRPTPDRLPLVPHLFRRVAAIDRATLAGMVNLTRIYTRTGDAGQTRLGDMSETTKTDPRLQAYADVDEANAHLGVAIASGGLDADVVAVLPRCRTTSSTSAPTSARRSWRPEYPPLRIEQEYVDRLEAWCDHYNEDAAQAAVVHPQRRHRAAPRCCTWRAPSSGAPSGRPGRRTRSTARR